MPWVAVPEKVSVAVLSTAKVLPLVVPTVTVETFSATLVVPSSSSSAIDGGSTDSDSSGKSPSSVMVTGYFGAHVNPMHVVPSGLANCTRSADKPGANSIVISKLSEPS